MSSNIGIDGQIRSVEDLLAAIERHGYLIQDHRHLRFWFRGHSQDTWMLTPGVYRPPIVRASEHDQLTIEQHLTQDFRVMSAGIRAGKESDVELYFLEQHYGMPTRLLDWSNSALAGLYFGVQAGTESDNFDGDMYFLDAYRLPQSKDHRGVATSRRPIIQSAVSVIFDWKNLSDFPDFIIPVRPDHLDRRMSLQRSCFTFHFPNCNSVNKINAPGLLRFHIAKADKQKIRDQLSILGVDDFSIFGDLPNLSIRLKEAYSKFKI